MQVEQLDTIEQFQDIHEIQLIRSNMTHRPTWNKRTNTRNTICTTSQTHMTIKTSWTTKQTQYIHKSQRGRCWTIRTNWKKTNTRQPRNTTKPTQIEQVKQIENMRQVQEIQEIQSLENKRIRTNWTIEQIQKIQDIQRIKTNKTSRTTWNNREYKKYMKYNGFEVTTSQNK